MKCMLLLNLCKFYMMKNNRHNLIHSLWFYQDIVNNICCYINNNHYSMKYMLLLNLCMFYMSNYNHNSQFHSILNLMGN